MATVLFLTGLSAGDNLAETSRGIMRIFEAAGHRAHELNLLTPGSLIDLNELLEATPIDFAVGICGYGCDAMTLDSGPLNTWAKHKVPFLTLHGDSPAYFFDRHVNLTTWHATMYGFGDHYDFRMRLQHKAGVFGIMSPLVFDTEPYEKMDFKAKRAGKIIFPKNASNPAQLTEMWRRLLPKSLANNLFELSDILVRNIENEAACDIDGLVTDRFRAKGRSVEHAPKIRLFYVAQLDDFLRRVKCALVGEVLKEFPVEIHGKGWDFMDMSNAKCTIINACDYHKTRALIKSSLAILDFTPNTVTGFHDRFARAVGLHTACLTNEQSCVTKMYGPNYGLTYQFSLESLRNKISVMLADPDTVVEAGIQAAKRFNEVLTVEAGLHSYFDAAEAVRLSAGQDFDGLQEEQPYFMWPPAALKN